MPADINRRQLLRERRGAIAEAAYAHGVSQVRLFGSVARGDDDERSDIDLLVDLEPGRSLLDLGGFQADMEEILQCRVDVVTPSGLRAHIRDRVNSEAVAL